MFRLKLYVHVLSPMTILFQFINIRPLSHGQITVHATPFHRNGTTRSESCKAGIMIFDGDYIQVAPAGAKGFFL
jgi:hypothetical protein